MKQKNILLTELLLLLLVSCVTYTMVYDIQYDISLHMVERPVDAKTRYGEQIITPIQEGDVLKYSFEDEMVKILWLPTASSIDFVLTNKTNYSIKIIWDEAAFVDEKGLSHLVKNKPQLPSVVVKQTTCAGSIFPVDIPIFPTRIIGKGKNDELQRIKIEVKTYIGKSYQVLLPLQIEGVINEYLFSFKVYDVKIQERRL